jgi:hypothetical protein
MDGVIAKRDASNALEQPTSDLSRSLMRDLVDCTGQIACIERSLMTTIRSAPSGNGRCSRAASGRKGLS